MSIEKLTNGIDVNELSLQETEVRERFRILNELYCWFRVICSQEGFPDFVLETDNGGVIRAEVEVESKSFIAHEHSVDECDLLICWRHNWGNCPLPVLTLSVEWINYLQLKRVRPYVIKHQEVYLTPSQLSIFIAMPAKQAISGNGKDE